MVKRRITETTDTGDRSFLNDEIWRLTTAQRLALTSPQEGDLVFDTDQKRSLTFIKGIWAIGSSVNDDNSWPKPASDFIGDTTRNSQTTLEGGVYFSENDIIANRILINITNINGTPTLRLLIYQDQNLDGVTEKIATIENFVPVAGQIEIPFNEGDVHIQKGPFFIAWGEDLSPGTISISTYNFTTVNLITSNVPVGYVPNNFTTSIPANTSPASIDFKIGGGDIVEGGNTDNVIIARMRKV